MGFIKDYWSYIAQKVILSSKYNNYCICSGSSQLSGSKLLFAYWTVMGCEPGNGYSGGKPIPAPFSEQCEITMLLTNSAPG